MKELNKDQVELLINYLNRRIENGRKRAESYDISGNTQLAMLANAQAAEADCTLAYLFGLMHNE